MPLRAPSKYGLMGFSVKMGKIFIRGSQEQKMYFFGSKT